MSEAHKIRKSEEEWRRQLTKEQFRITREAGTERPFTGPYLGETADGVYRCICCDEPLFGAEAKFESHCGWPSFTAPAGDAVSEHEDGSLMMRRTEVRCIRCDAHLGHVFNDGPPPTGLRYCINGHALRFDPGAAQD